MTKKGYNPPPEDAELPEKPPSLPPQVPPQSIPKPKPRPVTPECIHVTDDNSACGKGWVKEDGSPLPCKPDCYDYATEKLATDTAKDCIYIRHCSCGKSICGFAITGPSLPSNCGVGCDLYTCGRPADGRVYAPDHNPPQPPPAQPANQPPRCVYKVPAPPPEREWLGRDAKDDWSFGSPGVPDGMVCAGMFVRCADNCGPDCEDYRAVQPQRPTTQQHPASQLEEHELPASPKISLPQYAKELYQCGSISGYAFKKLSALIENYNPVQQPHACTCSQQQRQPRPFVRKDGLLTFIDSYSAFAVRKGALFAYAPGEIVKLRQYYGNSEALLYLDEIQTAIERWNRAATEPERNVRLKSIYQSLPFKDAKSRLERTFAEMEIDTSDVNVEIPLHKFWSALSIVMLLTDDFDFPEPEYDCASCAKRQITVDEIEYDIRGEFGTIRLDIRQGHRVSSVPILISKSDYERIASAIEDVADAP